VSSDPGAIHDPVVRATDVPWTHATHVSGGEPIAPIFLLSPPRSFSSIVCAMIGQHPQMYSLPETNLFGAETVNQWRAQCAVAKYNMDHGVHRAIAELYFGGQTENGIILARGWLRRRSHFSTAGLLEQLAKRVHPKLLIEKSPSLVYDPEALRRVFGVFPRARFIHLVRHPRGQGGSVMKRIERAGRRRQVPQWITDLASFSFAPGGLASDGELDPQAAWYVLNLNICDFLESIPKEQWMRIQGEAVITDPERALGRLLTWLNLRTDSEAMARMKHPEASPYSRVGPPGAEGGNDVLFMRNPFLRSSRAETHSLEGPLGWRADGAGFAPSVKELARKFGYE
jgi:Sulfotransferase family